MEIRSWREADTDWWVRLRLDWQPTFGEAQLRLLAAGQIATFVYRGVAWLEGERVGFASIARRPGHESAFALVLVSPERRGQGIGSTLFRELVGASSHDAFMASMPDDDVRSREVAGHWGFVVVSHVVRSRFDLRLTTSAPVVGPDRRVRVIDTASPESDKQWLSQLVLESDTSPEALELGWRTTLDDFGQMFPGIVWVVIEEAGRPIATASASPQEAGAWLLIYTGVQPQRRREGLARLAKMHLHAVVAGRGGRTLTTDNEARNLAILGLNESLGYERIGGELRFRREPPEVPAPPR